VVEVGGTDIRIYCGEVASTSNPNTGIAYVRLTEQAGGTVDALTAVLEAGTAELDGTVSVIAVAAGDLQAGAADLTGSISVESFAELFLSGALQAGATTVEGSGTVLVEVTGALAAAVATMEAGAEVALTLSGDLAAGAANIDGQLFGFAFSARVVRVRVDAAGNRAVLAIGRSNSATLTGNPTKVH
jgi:hypothetical protein